MGNKKKRNNTAKNHPERNSETTKIPELKIKEQTPKLREANWKTRIAIAGVLLGSVLGIGSLFKKAPKKSINTEQVAATPTKSKTEIPEALAYEAHIEVDGLKIHLDETWKNFHPENNTSVSDSIREILKKGVPFLKELGLELPKEEIVVMYDPSLLEKNQLGHVKRVFSINYVPEKESGEVAFNETSGNYFWLAKETSSPNIKLGLLIPQTFIHELFHVIHGVSFSGSRLWYEGIAEAIERIFEEKHPELVIIKDTNKLSQTNKEIEGNKYLINFIENEQIRDILLKQGYEEKCPSFLRPSSGLINNLAGTVWKPFIEANPDFLKLFFQKLKRWEKAIQRDHNISPELEIIFNTNLLEEAASHWTVSPNVFPIWFKKQKIFEHKTEEEDGVDISFIHKDKEHITCLTTSSITKEITIPGCRKKIEGFESIPQKLESETDSTGVKIVITIPKEGYTTTLYPLNNTNLKLTNRKSGKVSVIIVENSN